MIDEINDRKDRPAYVRFERVAIEDRIESQKQGRYIARDVDMALITPPYSKDVIKKRVDRWFEDMEANVRTGRMPREWVEAYKNGYDRWRNGQEIPLNGVPIRGWGVISPAQQETLIRINILTVEDLAKVTDEGIRRIGMGAVDLKNKAKAWLDQLTDKGAVTQEIASLKKENELLKGNIESLTNQVNALIKEVEKESVKVTIDDVPGVIHNDERERLIEQYNAKFGKNPHHLMKNDTIKQRIEAAP